MAKESPNVVTLCGGEAKLWIEQETSIHLKVVTPLGDPVELTKADALELSEALRRFAEEIPA